MYERLRDESFEIVAVAQDTGGEDVAGEFYDAAGASFTTLIDVGHAVSSLYDMTNVPTGVWIDEEGFIVRPNEVAYSQNVDFVDGAIAVNGEDYVAALADWVERGPESPYALSKADIVSRLSVPENDRALANASFRLGVYLYQIGDVERANELWDQAQALRPESWNYHRQDWSFLEREQASQNWRRKFEALEDRPYYEPLELEAGPR